MQPGPSIPRRPHRAHPSLGTARQPGRSSLGILCLLPAGAPCAAGQPGIQTHRVDPLSSQPRSAEGHTGLRSENGIYQIFRGFSFKEPALPAFIELWNGSPQTNGKKQRAHRVGRDPGWGRGRRRQVSCREKLRPRFVFCFVLFFSDVKPGFCWRSPSPWSVLAPSIPEC